MCDISVNLSAVISFIWNSFFIQDRRNLGDWGTAAPPPQIFAKVDLLPIDSDSDKKKIEMKK